MTNWRSDRPFFSPRSMLNKRERINPPTIRARAFGGVPVEFLYYSHTQTASASFRWSPAQKKKSRKQNSLSAAAVSWEEPLWLHLFLVAIHIWRDYQLHCWAVPRSVRFLSFCVRAGYLRRYIVPCIHFYLFELLLGLSRLWSITTTTAHIYIIPCLDFCANTSTVYK